MMELIKNVKKKQEKVCSGNGTARAPVIGVVALDDGMTGTALILLTG